jgi:cell division septum initiation protein DivIVA
MQLEQIMADDVVDIRKRIEEMRNEVSAAIVSRQELNDATYDVGQNADISLGTQTIEPSIRAANDRNSPLHTATTSSANPLVSDDMIKAHRGLETALKMPAFQLNVRNQTSNNLLLTVIGIQLLTNILLILMVWMKLG